jgi:uncharacterized protein YggT (Ycf19 family)
MQYYALYQVYRGVDIFLRALQFVLLAYSIMSWVASPVNRLYMFLSRVAQPLITPFQRISMALIRRGFRFDVSVILAIVSLEIVRTFIVPGLLNWLMLR